MGTISAKRLNEALAKAKNVGLVEESFEIDGCVVSLRNLRFPEYTAVIKDCEGLSNIEYVTAYQCGQLSYSMVEVNGVDLREADFIEVEEEDRKNPGQTRTVKLETHAYVLKYILGTWSKEAVNTAYRKFGDVVELAERKAKEGINFIVPEETGEDRYRRLLLEAKSCEDDIPDSLIEKILEANGLMRKTTAEEIKSVMERTDQLAREQEGTSSDPPVEPPIASPAAPVPADRQPLNRVPVRVPVDPHRTLQQAIDARHQPVPERTQAIAALEADAGSTGIEHADTLPGRNGEPIPVVRPETEPEVVEIKDHGKFDPKAASQILDQPPAAGLNPRFRPPARTA